MCPAAFSKVRSALPGAVTFVATGAVGMVGCVFGLATWLGAAGLVGLGVVVAMRRTRPWLIALFAGLLAASLVYWGMAVFWMLFPVTGSTGFGSGIG